MGDMCVYVHLLFKGTLGSFIRLILKMKWPLKPIMKKKLFHHLTKNTTLTAVYCDGYTVMLALTYNSVESVVIAVSVCPGRLIYWGGLRVK